MAITANSTSHRNQPQPRADRILDRMPKVGLAFFLGLAEGTFFFVVPDVLISLVSLIRPARAWRHVAAATAGAFMAGALSYHCSSHDRRRAEAFIARVPFVRSRMLEHVNVSYCKRGPDALFLGPLNGIPYKIYAVEAPQFVSRGVLLWATVPARAARFLFVWGAFAIVGSCLRKRLQRPDRQFCHRPQLFLGFALCALLGSGCPSIKHGSSLIQRR